MDNKTKPTPKKPRWPRVLITLSLVVGALALLVTQLPRGAFSTDLSGIGQGTPALVVARDKNYLAGGEVMDLINTIRPETWYGGCRRGHFRCGWLADREIDHPPKRRRSTRSTGCRDHPLSKVVKLIHGKIAIPVLLGRDPPRRALAGGRSPDLPHRAAESGFGLGACYTGPAT